MKFYWQYWYNWGFEGNAALEAARQEAQRYAALHGGTVEDCGDYFEVK